MYLKAENPRNITTAHLSSPLRTAPMPRVVRLLLVRERVERRGDHWHETAAGEGGELRGGGDWTNSERGHDDGGSEKLYFLH